MTDNLQTQDSTLDEFDRQMQALAGLPRLIETKAAPVRVINFLGQVETWIVQTIRQPDQGDFIFVELSNRHGHTRLVFPPTVARMVSRQRDSLTKRNASRAARERAARRTAPFRTFTTADRKKGATARAATVAKRRARKAKAKKKAAKPRS